MDTKIEAALIAAGVALATTILAEPLKYWVGKRALRHKLTTEYEYEQRRKLRELIGSYHGRLIEACDRFSNRMWNLYHNENRGWLERPKPGHTGYYLQSTMHRFISVMCIVRQFEEAAIYIDARIADTNDFTFLKFARSFQWVMTDVALFEGLNYDNANSRDHFFSDNLRQICDMSMENGSLLSPPEFLGRLDNELIPRKLADFFYDLRRNENRYRWDRLVCLHLLILGFPELLRLRVSALNRRCF